MGVYLEMARKNIRAQLEYNYSTYLLIIGQTFAQMTFILGFILLFRSFGSIKGYTFGEILSKGIGNMPDYIKRGNTRQIPFKTTFSAPSGLGKRH